MFNSTPAVLAAIQTNFNAVFNKTYSGYTPMYKSLGMAMDVTAKSKIEVYAYLDQVPGVREWLGPRVVNSAKKLGYSLTNKTWETTLGIRREDVDYDQIGVYTPMVQQLATNTSRHADEELFKLFWAGQSGTCITGKAFFATDHPIGNQGGSFSNKLATATYVLATDGVAYGAAISQLRQVLSGQGMYNVITMDPQFVLVVPPALETTAKRLLEAEFLGLTSKGAENNIWKGSADLLVNPLLASAVTGDSNSDKAWFVYTKNTPIKPLIYQKFGSPETAMLTKPTDSNVFMDDTYLYGVRLVDAVGYGMPHLAIGVFPW